MNAAPLRLSGRSASLAGARATARSSIVPAPPRRQLPAWPLLVLFPGFVLWWALGASPFMPAALAVVMILLLVARKRSVVVPGLLPWGAFLLWVLASAVVLPDAGDAIAYAQRVAELVAVGVFMLYVVNAPEKLPRDRVVSCLLAVWATVVGLGLLAMVIPEFRLSTPVGALLPQSLTDNDLVRDLVFPRMAEIQQPWGAPQPYIRPSAPFPYANSWGVAFVVLTPVALSRLVSTRSVAMRFLLVAGIGVSFLPALATSNRGMFVGLAAAVLYVMVRLAMRREVAQLAWMLGCGLAGVAVLVGSGALGEILGRQNYSDSTGGRLALYGQTLSETLHSPYLGFGTPRLEPTIGVSLGTQGYVWMLMFCYGFVGLALFLYFLVGGIIRTRKAPGTSGLWLHSIPFATLVMIPFYSFSVVQLSCVAVVIALLLRERYRPGDA